MIVLQFHRFIDSHLHTWGVHVSSLRFRTITSDLAGSNGAARHITRSFMIHWIQFSDSWFCPRTGSTRRRGRRPHLRARTPARRIPRFQIDQSCVCVYVYVCVCMCVWACVCVHACARMYARAHVFIYIGILKHSHTSLLYGKNENMRFLIIDFWRFLHLGLKRSLRCLFYR